MQQSEVLDKYIIIIEDEKPIADLICYSLGKEGIRTEAFGTGKEGLERLKENNHPDLVVLDVMLPDMDGFDVCKEVTSNYQIPVILLTAKSNIIDKITGLEIGADDYITKPFDVLELSARIRTVLRRLNNHKEQDIIRVSHNVAIYADERKVLKNGEKLELTRKEFDLLTFLINNGGKVFSREILLDCVWGYDFLGDTRTVDIHIQRLRKKIDDEGSVSFIETVFGVGYMVPNPN